MLQIHGVPVSVHTRKVIVTALEKGLAFANVPVIPFDPPPNWAELSPTGKIPVLVDDGEVLRDSSVICAYFERVHADHPIYPRDPRAFAQALWLEEYADGTVFRDVVHGLFFEKVIKPNMLKQPTDRGAIATILDSRVPKVFGYLEQCCNGKYLVAEAFSVADIAVVSNLINYHYLGHRLDGYPKLLRYFQAQLQRPSLRSALAAERSTATAMALDSGFLAG